MNDKIQRLKNMLMSRRDTAVDEPLEDAYLDVSVIMVLWLQS